MCLWQHVGKDLATIEDIHVPRNVTIKGRVVLCFQSFWCYRIVRNLLILQALFLFPGSCSLLAFLLYRVNRNLQAVQTLK